MSKFEDGSYGSLTGVSLIGKVLAGRCSMKYTRAAAGSGQIPEGMTPKTMTGPAGYVMDAMIAAVTNPWTASAKSRSKSRATMWRRAFT